MEDSFLMISRNCHQAITSSQQRPYTLRNAGVGQSADLRAADCFALKGAFLRNYRRSLGLLAGALILAGNATYPPPTHGQPLQRDPVTLEILKAGTTFRRFHQERVEYQRFCERERLCIPAYNIQLSKAVVAFHHHIQDMHYRHVDCKLCRQYVSRIKQLTKRIDAGMK